MRYELASPGGLTFGFYFFLALTGAIALMIYALMTRPTVRRAELGIGIVKNTIAVPFAGLLWFVLFAAIYLVSLSGFHTVTVREDRIDVEYAIPSTSISLPLSEIGDVLRRPAYRTLWQLEIYMLTGRQFKSTPGSYRSIREAAQDIERRRTP